MGFERELAAKKRKVFYDEFSGSFIMESKNESIKRQCEIRARLADVINKSEESKCRVACKQVDAEKHMFLMRKERTMMQHSEALQNHKAHLHVLEKLAQERKEHVECNRDILGKYPPKSLRKDLGEQIERELKEMSPVVQRRKEVKRLLKDRTSIREYDRTMGTQDLFSEIKNTKSRVSSSVNTPPMKKHKYSALILPAISVRMVRTTERPRVGDSVSHKNMFEREGNRSIEQVAVVNSAPQSTKSHVLAPVFITEQGRGNTLS